MPVLDREALEASPLADLHAIASELSIDGYRRLRKADLIDTLLARQGGSTDTADTDTDAEEDEDEAGGARRRRGRRGGRGRAGGRAAADTADPATPAATPTAGGKGASRAADAESDEEVPTEGQPLVEGVVELLPNGSGFLRVTPPDPSDEDVYISAAQVKRCELVSGDRVSGPRRKPQRSERFASLVRVDTINGQSAAEVSERGRYDDLDAVFPGERFRLGSEDETLKAIEFLTPFGRGSRVTITGGPWAGKSHTLRALAEALAADAELTVFVALAGVRPEELTDWRAAATPEGALPAAAASLSFAASADAQDHAVELVVEQAKRIATRGGHAVVLIDSLDGLHPQSARKALAAARNLAQGGSLTVIATAGQPVGGETTVIALDPALTSTGRFPALDLVHSGTLRADLLVGAAGAAAIVAARVEAFGLPA